MIFFKFFFKTSINARSYHHLNTSIKYKTNNHIDTSTYLHAIFRVHKPKSLFKHKPGEVFPGPVQGRPSLLTEYVQKIKDKVAKESRGDRTG